MSKTSDQHLAAAFAALNHGRSGRPQVPVDDLSTLELLKVLRGSLIAQREALEDQHRFLAKTLQCVADLAERVHGWSAEAEVEAVAEAQREVAHERELRAALTRQLREAQRAARGKASEPAAAQRDEARPPRQATPEGPWLAFKSIPGRGGPFACGLPPYGHRWLDGGLEPVAYEQEVLARVRQRRQQDPGVTWSALAEELNGQGKRTRRGNPWKGPALQAVYDKHLQREADAAPGAPK